MNLVYMEKSIEYFCGNAEGYDFRTTYKKENGKDFDVNLLRKTKKVQQE
uniref:Site-specific DNA-methyltransferase (adenine-specific) n=1 Tax=Heterorhabditis bacteriophora TaxID=37862 RepID=A0A1I7WE32_HETBA